jgi:soluble lytic murein transglycosylase-like protein/TolA-binding protein
MSINYPNLKLNFNPSEIYQKINNPKVVLPLSIALVALFSGLLFLFSSSIPFLRLTSVNYKNYQPFNPGPDFAYAIQVLPDDKKLAYKKLEELTMFASPSNDARKTYIMAQINQRSGNYQEALKQYQSINLRLVPYLADRVLLHIAEVSAELGLEKNVENACKTIIRSYQGSLSVSGAHYELARSFLRQSKKDEAIREFEFVRKRFPSSQHSIGAAFYLGSLKDDFTQRDILWEEYLKNAPDGRFASDIIAEWSKDLNSRSKIQKSLIGYSLLVRGQKLPSVENYQLIGEDVNAQNWLTYANLLIEKNQKLLAHRVLLDWAQKVSSEEEFRTAVTTLFYNASIKERENYASLLIPSVNEERAAYVMWKLAAFNKAQKKEILSRLISRYPNSNWAATAEADLFWELYKSGDINSAKSYGYMILKKHSSNAAMAKVMFWLGKIAEQEGQFNQAKGLYSQVLNTHFASYYAMRAQGRLKVLAGGLDPGWSSAALDRRPTFPRSWRWPIPSQEVSRMHPTVQELFALNLWQEINGLISSDELKKYPGIKAWELIVLEEKVPEGIRVAANYLDKNKPKFYEDKDFWMLSYPLIYFDNVKETSAKNGLPPLLLQSLMRQESRFQAHAVSRSNAIGLCQLLPSTAKEVARSINFPVPDKTTLFNPAYNIELGGKYLGGLVARFNGQAQLAVAAYNGGPGSVTKWLKEKPNADPDYFVETIPFDETRNYVVSVFENFWVYSNVLASGGGQRNYEELSDNVLIDSKTR